MKSVKKTIEGNASADPESGSVLIALQDSGPGLDATELQRVFRPFYTTKSQGMGMGLAISRSVIEAHHGRFVGDGQHANRRGLSVHVANLSCRDVMTETPLRLK